MKKITTIYHILVAFLVLLSNSPLPAGVNPDGSYSESLPIEVPAGRNGIQPKLALTYNSNGGNGIVGVGWSLQGLPALTRINYGTGINYNGQDTIAGPEGRLIDVSASAGMPAGTIFHAENETWSKYEPLGWDGNILHAGNRCGDSACSWRVTDRSGIVYLYGDAGASRVMAIDATGTAINSGAVRVWALSRVSDLNGNYYQVEYHQDGGQYYPKKISYTLGNWAPHFFAVIFDYDTTGRPDKETSFGQSSMVQTNWRLQGIVVTYHNYCFYFFTCNDPVRNYSLEYSASGSIIRSRLSKWREFDAASQIKSTLTFTWNDANAGFSPAGNFNPPYALWNRPGKDSDGQRIIDLNGDGLPDLLRGLHLDGTGYFGAWINTGNGWAYSPQWNPPVSIWFSANGKKDNEGVEILDINNDGLPDIVKFLHDGGSSNYVGAWLNNGNGWSYAPQFSPPYALWNRQGGDCDGQRLVDVNGDGLPDLLRGLHLDGTGYFAAWLNTGNGWVAAPQWNPPVSIWFSANGKKDNEGVEILDINNDGRPDIIKYLHDGGTANYVGAWLNNGNGWTYAPQFNPPYVLWHRPAADSDGQRLIDVNGDGLPDLLRGLHSNGSSYFAAWLNTGNGWISAPQWNPPTSLRFNGTYMRPGFPPIAVPIKDDEGVEFVDVNKDGLIDIIKGLHNGSSYFGAWLNTGNGWAYAPEWSPPHALGFRVGETIDNEGVHVLDINGDGYADVIRGLHDGGPTYYGAWLNNAHHANLLSKIESSNGAINIVEYAPAAQSADAVCVGCAGPGIKNTTPRYLVNKVTSKNNRNLDGSNSNVEFSTLYEYYNGRFSMGYVHERMSLGFEKIKTTDVNSGNYSITTYRQDKPFHGQAIVSRNYLSNDTLVSEQISAQPQLWLCDANGCSHDPSNNPNPALPKQFRTIGEAQEKSYENGVLISRKFNEILSQDIYGNPLKTKTGIEANGILKTTYKFAQFINSTSTTYAIGLPYAEKSCFSTVECNEGDSNFIAAAKSYFDQQALGLVGDKHLVTRKEAYVSTGDATGTWVPETYGYYDSGLVKDSVDGMGIRTEIEYDPDYQQFPYTVKKIDGSKTRVFSYRMDYRFSKPNYKLDGETGIEEWTSFDDSGFVRAVEVKNNGVVISKKTSFKSAYNEQPAWKKDCVNYGPGFTQEHCSRKIGDALGRVYREEYPEFVAGVEKLMAIERRYDSRGRENKVSQPFDASNGSPTQWNTKTYDVMGRVSDAITFNNRTTHTDYLTSSLPPGTVSGTKVRGPDGKEKRVFNNIEGKTAITHEASHSATQYTTVNYEYDALGRLSTVISPQSKTLNHGVTPTSVGYVGRSSLQRYIDDPVAGRTDYEYYFNPGQSNFSKLKTETRAGYVTAFEYNGGFGRVSKATKAAVASPSNILETIEYQYDETDIINGKGRLTTLTHVKDGFTIQERYSYDDRGEIFQTVRRISHATETLCADTEAMPCLQTFGKTKDELGRVTDMLYPDGTHSEINYVDAYQSFVSKIKHNGTVYAEYSDYSYDIAPHIGKVTYGNGLTHQYTYVADTGLLDTFKITNTAPLLDLEYQYDAAYNIQRIQDNVISDLSVQFEYDALNRLKSAVLDSGITRTYKFDKDGQPESKGNLELKANRRMSYADGKTYPQSDEVYNPNTSQWQPNETFTWSANGKLMTKGPYTFGYDSNSMMTSATEVDPQNTATVVGDTKFYYDHTGQRFLKTHLRNGVLIKTWYLGDGIELREKYTGATGNSSGIFDAYQATKYIYGIDDKKLASITGSVQSSRPIAGAGAMFALADGYSSTSIAGLTNKVYYTFYGVFQHEHTGKTMRISALSLLALLLVLYLIYSNRRENEFPMWVRIASIAILVSFVSVNCGSGNAPGTIPNDLANSRNSIISALYTGLPAGTVYYSHNHLGSGALVTDSAGNEIFRITYTEHGEIDLANSGKWNATLEVFERNVSDAEIAIIAVKYTGQEFDPETGFYYYNARYYDPQLGIFTTPDTEFDAGQGSFAYNRHMYVRGNPIMYNDPTGHFFFLVAAAIAVGGAIAGGTGGDIKGWLNGTKQWDWKGAAGGAALGVSLMAGGAAGMLAAGAMTSAIGGTAAVTASVGNMMAVGMAAGMAGGFAGAASGAWMMGANFGDGLMAGVRGGIFGGLGGAAGGAAGFAGLSMFGDGFWGTTGAGAMAGGAGGFTAGAMNNWANGRSFGDGLRDGLTAGAWGGAIGGALAALTYTPRPNADASKGDTLALRYKVRKTDCGGGDAFCSGAIYERDFLREDYERIYYEDQLRRGREFSPSIQDTSDSIITPQQKNRVRPDFKREPNLGRPRSSLDPVSLLDYAHI
ncbi:MAG: VCBS repeat-containing protein [Turneriella sp.]|nr:VCBS repeat-containing protein [Turneriella sp.]